MEMISDGIVAALGLAVVGLFVWAVKNHFASEGMTWLARGISLIVIIETVYLAWAQFAYTQPMPAKILGIVLMGSSVWLFFAAMAASRDANLRFAFAPEQPHTLVQEGPYKLVRHPFYVSYLLLWLGWTIAVATIWAWPLFLIVLALYWGAARMEENKFSQTAMAEAHAEYKRRVGFFWPKFSRG
jgi:protein-S-isoprenylcysteine O-methyltransferase Ste14